jgi:hypothetical protein
MQPMMQQPMIDVGVGSSRQNSTLSSPTAVTSMLANTADDPNRLQRLLMQPISSSSPPGMAVMAMSPGIGGMPVLSPGASSGGVSALSPMTALVTPLSSPQARVTVGEKAMPLTVKIKGRTVLPNTQPRRLEADDGSSAPGSEAATPAGGAGARPMSSLAFINSAPSPQPTTGDSASGPAPPRLSGHSSSPQGGGPMPPNALTPSLSSPPTALPKTGQAPALRVGSYATPQSTPTVRVGVAAATPHHPTPVVTVGATPNASSSATPRMPSVKSPGDDSGQDSARERTAWAANHHLFASMPSVSVGGGSSASQMVARSGGARPLALLAGAGATSSAATTPSPHQVSSSSGAASTPGGSIRVGGLNANMWVKRPPALVPADEEADAAAASLLRSSMLAASIPTPTPTHAKGHPLNLSDDEDEDVDVADRHADNTQQLPLDVSATAGVRRLSVTQEFNDDAMEASTRGAAPPPLPTHTKVHSSATDDDDALLGASSRNSFPPPLPAPAPTGTSALTQLLSSTPPPSLRGSVKLGAEQDAMANSTHSNSNSTSVPWKPTYKTKQCRSFTQTGKCKYGDRCMFAHGSVDQVSVREVGDGPDSQEASMRSQLDGSWKLEKSGELGSGRYVGVRRVSGPTNNALDGSLRAGAAEDPALTAALAAALEIDAAARRGNTSLNSSLSMKSDRQHVSPPPNALAGSTGGKS